MLLGLIKSYEVTWTFFRLLVFSIAGYSISFFSPFKGILYVGATSGMLYKLGYLIWNAWNQKSALDFIFFPDFRIIANT